MMFVFQLNWTKSVLLRRGCQAVRDIDTKRSSVFPLRELRFVCSRAPMDKKAELVRDREVSSSEPKAAPFYVFV